MQKKLTALVPADLHLRVASHAKQRGVRIDLVVEEALLLYFRTPQADLGKLYGPMAGLSSADRKRVEIYIELMKSGAADVKASAARRTAQFLAISRSELKVRK